MAVRLVGQQQCGLVELNVFVQVQHIKNKKYNNSFTSKWKTCTPNATNFTECFNVKEMRTQFFMWNEMQNYI